MSIAEETLMAYVDGELDPAAHATIAAAIESDPDVAARVERHRALRARIQSAYRPVLAEPVPARLLDALHNATRPSNVVGLEGARAARADKAIAAPKGTRRWRVAASMAASLLVAAGAGWFASHRSPPWMVRAGDGALIASAALDERLSSDLSGDAPPGSAVLIGLTFTAKSGDYCRTFLVSSGEPTTGLACRAKNRWEIRALENIDTVPSGGSEIRTASSSLPPAILAAVQDRIAGDPLDRTAEIAARGNSWRSPIQR